MNCPRCNGFVMTRLVEHPNVKETHCLSCGWYYNPPLPVPPRDPYWRKDKCRNCQNSVEVGFALCRGCRTYQAAYRTVHPTKRNRSGPPLPVGREEE